ncbi:MAG: TlpA disulfide reductase family protein [Bacteroidota bacterium]
MRAIYPFALIFLLACETNEEKSPTEASLTDTAPITLEGSITTTEQRLTLHLWDLDNHDYPLLDTLTVDEKGIFSTDYTFEPNLYAIAIEGEPKVWLALDEGQQIEVTIKPNHIETKGSKDTDLYEAYEQFREATFERLVVPTRVLIEEAEAKRDLQQLAVLNEQDATNVDQYRAALTQFVQERMGASIATYATSVRWRPDADLPFMRAIARDFELAHPHSALSKQLIDKVNRFEQVALGAPALDIQLPTPTGEVVALSSLKGKYVLVDFWASWCRPCRQENPNYVALYQKYKSRDFEIYGVSLDEKKAAWEKTIAKDQLSWVNVSDLKGWNNSAALQYNVTAIPANFLLDSNGKIIAKNLRGKALAAQLQTLFD